MKKHTTARRSRMRRLWMIGAVLAGGFAPMTCTMIIRDSFVSATKASFATLLDPCNFQIVADSGQCGAR